VSLILPAENKVLAVHSREKKISIIGKKKKKGDDGAIIQGNRGGTVARLALGLSEKKIFPLERGKKGEKGTEGICRNSGEGSVFQIKKRGGEKIPIGVTAAQEGGGKKKKEKRARKRKLNPA